MRVVGVQLLQVRRAVHVQDAGAGRQAVARREPLLQLVLLAVLGGAQLQQPRVPGRVLPNLQLVAVRLEAEWIHSM